VLKALQQKSGDQALAAYGDWYSQLACASSWQDHLLDEVSIIQAWCTMHACTGSLPCTTEAAWLPTQIMAGRGNVLAKAAAQCAPAAKEAHLHAAAAHDLNALQRLSISTGTLAGMRSPSQNDFR
jgi:hypothetical protein